MQRETRRGRLRRLHKVLQGIKPREKWCKRTRIKMHRQQKRNRHYQHQIYWS